VTAGALFEPELSSGRWRGTPPAHWPLRRLKWSISGLYNGIWGDEPDGDDDIICIRVADFDRIRRLVVADPPTLRSVSSGYREQRVLRKGDLLIEKSGGGDNQLVGCVVHFDRDFEAVCSNFVARVPLRDGMVPQYWSYVHSSIYSARLNFPSIKQTTGIQNLDAEAYFNIEVPFPSAQEQFVIASYLDRETARIDGLIAEKERMLALLEEKRAALISHVVTRGLNPKAPLKFSGQKWLGKIPAHWSAPRAKGLFREVDRRTETGDEILLSLRMGKGLVPHNDVSEKLLEASDLTGFKKIEPGQMVINRMRAASGLIAVATEPGLVSPDYAVFDIVDQELSIDYFLELFKTSLLQALFRSASKGLGTGEQGFLRLYSDAFLALHFPFPPADEQHEIASFIRQERSEMLHAETLLRHSIDLAKERRAALITAAVTGQIPLEVMTG
jgi:type I restriction enzyme S subunit